MRWVDSPLVMRPPPSPTTRSRTASVLNQSRLVSTGVPTSAPVCGGSTRPEPPSSPAPEPDQPATSTRLRRPQPPVARAPGSTRDTRGSTNSAVDVSVVVAVSNGAETLAQCIESVLGQSGCAVELIIVDAMSSDDTKSIVESYGGRIATYVREPDNGIYDAWNKALAIMRGEWCAFLGADDYFVGGRSASALLACARQSATPLGFVHGGILRVGGDEDHVWNPAPLDLLSHLQSGAMVPHQGVLHHVGSMQDIGGFDASFRIAGDFDALLQLLTRRSGVRCGEVVTVMRHGGVSSRPSLREERAREVARALSRHAGRWAGIRFYVRKRIAQSLVAGVETLAIHVFGQHRGVRLLLAARRRLKQQPELLTRAGDRGHLR